MRFVSMINEAIAVAQVATLFFGQESETQIIVLNFISKFNVAIFLTLYYYIIFNIMLNKMFIVIYKVS